MGQLSSKIWRAVNSLKGLDSTHFECPKIDLTGKWIIITGSNNGIGLEAAKHFAKAGANLILACREPPPLETHPTDAVAQCKTLASAEGHETIIEWWQLEMDQISSVESFAQRWLDTGRPLDILCNNAGMSARKKLAKPISQDGFEVVHQVNFLSHVLLTHKLLPSIARSSYARIVCTVSSRHFNGIFDLEHFNGEPGMPGDAYGNNKLYSQIWLTELQSRLLQNDRFKHITINGIHPGFVDTVIVRPPPSSSDTLAIRFLRWLAGKLAITPEQGSLAIVNAATNPELGSDGLGGGHYINRIWISPAMPICHDTAARLMLWERLDQDLKLRKKGLLQGLDD